MGVCCSKKQIAGHSRESYKYLFRFDMCIAGLEKRGLCGSSIHSSNGEFLLAIRSIVIYERFYKKLSSKNIYGSECSAA